ncbi:DUF551 domain-containing protein [Salmonella enterica]|nr:DUF551 domain-containing protein [Salmonella enterica]EDZ4179061.1 DUF551 domain-containing protein [Salmonella enterica]EEF9020042.1 DUF551 domain-containing protein [Salmonella enterica]HAI7280288.1 DUF551 domain-containing protein [Escherichia coli]HDY1252235.1 DUF551 domain-containing protein [Escherichia coli]
MTTITKERIELFIKNPLENGLTRGEQMELARIALASLEADPVKRVNSDQMRRVCLEANRHLDKYDAMAKEVNKLLGRIAPPAPVVPEEISTTHTMLPAMSDQLMAFGYVKGWNACRAAMLHAGNFRKNANSSTNNFREIAETSTNSPVIPGEVLSAILKFARVRADFDDFDGDRRGIGDCQDEAEQELIVTINKYASQLAAEPIATNDVREQQTAVPPIQADVAQAIENLKQKLVECNRYNYCADAVKGVEDACRAVSYSQADNQPASGNQAAESNRGNEWTGNPDIDNAIIMLDRIDTLENCDDDRIEAVKAVLRRLAVNSPVIPDGWINCSERMPEKNQNVLISVNFDSSLVEPLICSARYTGITFRRGDVTIKPGNGIEQATHWMPLPEPPQESKSE